MCIPLQKQCQKFKFTSFDYDVCVLSPMSQATPVPPMAMAAVPVSTNSMFSHDAITVQQTTRGCFQECFGCEAKSEYRVFPGHVEEGQPRKENIPQMGHLLEESGCLCRTCFTSQRGFPMKLAAGSLPADTEDAGPTVMVYEKPFSLPICRNIPMETLRECPHLA